jgi:cation diffusion facilitator CzcD-associated flavoprotein CzcO/acetyl esterase/lipase
MVEQGSWSATEPPATDADVVVVGAGFSGLFMLARLRELGFSTIGIEAAHEVGGTWFWNRYPGLRCDIPTTDYTYTWDPELEQEWTWSEKFATQPEILRYLQHVADRHDLRRDIRFSTRVNAMTWDEPAAQWVVTTDRGTALRSRFVIMATGALSVPKDVDIEGLETFTGRVYSTSRWPAEPVDFTGRRVAVVGTGSSGIQVIPVIAEQADQLTVFQRTAAFSLPARNGAPPAYRTQMLAEDREGYREAARRSSGGVPIRPPDKRAAELSEDERRARCEAAWAAGEIAAVNMIFADYLTDQAANDVIADFVRQKIRSIVADPQTAELLCPKDFPFMAKRPCFDTGYYESFNRPHVRLVDLRRSPIERLVSDGIQTADEVIAVDDLVLATGYDALTGALLAVDVKGRAGRTLRDKWAHGPATYLGLMSEGFPNLFMVTGPGSPSVLSNMVVAIEQHVTWIARCLADLRSEGFASIEPTPTAEDGWVRHVNDCADITLLPAANSWYVGANVPGKPRVFMPYVGGVGVYRDTCEAVVERGYLGFRLEGPARAQCRDGVVNRHQPDVAALARDITAAGASHPDELVNLDRPSARRTAMVAAATRPTGPEPAEVRDDVLADGSLVRIYRPEAQGPLPVIVHLNGGAWELGDPGPDAFGRDLCRRSGAAVVSLQALDTRRSVDDYCTAVRCIADHAADFGGSAARLALAGWSAGADTALGVAVRLRDVTGPSLSVLYLINPAAPVRQLPESPEGLPPTVLLVGELDPALERAESLAERLADAGVLVTSYVARGHDHLSLTIPDIRSGDEHRSAAAAAVRTHLDFAVTPAAAR